MKRFAIDIGGTFTDLVALNDETGEVTITKRPSTPQDPAVGLLDCIKEIELAVSDYNLFVHGTTIGINAYLQGKGEDVSLITTEGFRDVYEIGRTNRVEPYNLTYRKPKRLVPRRCIYTVPERVDSRGKVVTALDEHVAAEVIERICGLGIRSIAVCLLHSYANPCHEERLYEMIKERHPEIYVSLSSRIIREYREFERTNVTVLDAYIKPLVVKYLEYLEDFFQKQGFSGDFMLQRSGGGVLPAAFVSERPVETLFSGPAGGVMGALHIAKGTPYKNLILGDVGGTSFDVSLITNAQEQVTTEARVDHTPIMIPMLDIRSIGAGGGSIAWLDEANAIHVGPQSAGAEPGPVCYGRGGMQPTVTDAAVCNNYISAENFLGGKMQLNVNEAREAVRRKIADPLGLSVPKAANGIMQIMVDRMVGVIREIMTEKGEDPRRYSLLMFGGAGPLFGSFILERFDIGKVIIPKEPANFSAYGMMITDVVYDYKQTYVRLLEESDVEETETLFSKMEARGLENLEKTGIPKDARRILRSIDVRYLGLTHALNVPVTQLSKNAKSTVADDFHALYERIYGYRLDNPIQIVRLNAKVVGVLQKPELATAPTIDSGSEKAIKGKREIFLSDGPATCRTYDRERLKRDDRIEGPTIVEETSSTTFVAKGQKLRVDEWGNLLIERM